MLYLAFLRGINVGGKRRVPMAELRDALAELGLARPRSLLQSGNLLFETHVRSASELESRLEAETEERFGFPVDYFIRTSDEVRAVLADNPFAAQTRTDPAHVLVMFLRSEPEAERARALSAAIAGRERAAVAGRTAYIVYPDGIGNSPVTNAFLERRLGTRGTARNCSTLRKMEALAQT